MPLKPGDPAPAFETTDHEGAAVRSADLVGTRYVIYFYPHNDTMLCTREACAFEEARMGLADVGVPVFGVSPNSQGSNARFAAKHGLGFRLLTDKERRLVKDFDAEGLLGRVRRITYLIGPDGKVEAVHRSEVTGAGHAKWARETVLAAQAQQGGR